MRLIDLNKIPHKAFRGDRDDLVDALFAAPTVDAVAVCRCKDCKHRPTKPEKYDDGFDLAFPDEVCPCYCDGDPFYSWYPKDDWFCPKGECKGWDE